MSQSSSTTATEYLCFTEQKNKVCVGWDGRCGSFLIMLDNYPVVLPKPDQIPVGSSVVGNVDVRATITISPEQVRALAYWLLQALDEWPPHDHGLFKRPPRA